MRENKGVHKGLIFVISGPSGSGKTTLLKKLLWQGALKNKLVKSVSFTTRPKRLGEKEGRDYFFISQTEFKKRLKLGEILEWTKYLDYYYGTPVDFLKRCLRKKQHLALCLDLKGAFWIKRYFPKNTISIFVKSSSLSVLRKRIEKRSRATRKEEIHRRMEMAKKELREAKKFDYVLLNRKLNKVIAELKKIILQEISKCGE